jgi:hypothetical protein
MALHAVPSSLKAANRFVDALHRHSGVLPGAKFAIAVVDDEGIVHGVAIAGNPKARGLTDGLTLEVNRVCTDGARNGCSFLYGCCTRAAKALGYQRVVTYTQGDEDGASLKASGWIAVAENKARDWKRERGEDRNVSGGATVRWEITFPDRPAPVWPSGIDTAEDQLTLTD